MHQEDLQSLYRAGESQRIYDGRRTTEGLLTCFEVERSGAGRKLPRAGEFRDRFWKFFFRMPMSLGSSIRSACSSVRSVRSSIRSVRSSTCSVRSSFPQYVRCVPHHVPCVPQCVPRVPRFLPRVPRFSPGRLIEQHIEIGRVGRIVEQNRGKSQDQIDLTKAETNMGMK